MIFTYLTINAKIWLRLWDFITLIQGMAPASPDLFIYLRSKKPAPPELIQKKVCACGTSTLPLARTRSQPYRLPQR
jgi:hypothetical protein